MLALGLIGAAVSAYVRVVYDTVGNRSVVVLVDWRELNQLQEPDEKGSNNTSGARLISDRRTHDEPWELMRLIPKATIAYGEETVGDFLAQGILSPADVTTTGATFEVSDKRYVSDIERGARRHGYPIETRGDNLLVQIPHGGSDGANLQPLAWRDDVIATAKAFDIPIMLRPAGTSYLGPGGLERSVNFRPYNSLMLFQGTQVLGYPHELRAVADELKKMHRSFCWVEFDEQDGAQQLASMMSPDVVRVHSITTEEMEKYTIQRAVARYELALTERGVRVIFLRPFGKQGLNALGSGQTNMKLGYREQLRLINKAYFTAIRRMIQERGLFVDIFVSQNRTALLRLEQSAVFSWGRRIAVTLATSAALVLLITLLVPQLTTRLAMSMLLLGVVAAALAVLSKNIFTVVLLATGIIFPTLGFWAALLLYQRNAHGKPAPNFARLGWALIALVVATAISAAGGLLIHGGMWDARTLLRIDQYRGVTLALALPVLFVAAYCWHAESLQGAWDSAGRRLAGFWQRLLALWLSPIRYGDVAVIMLAVGALGIVLLRSGNEGPIGVLGAEGWLRGFLESALEVRPRTKELIGHPALVLFLLTIAWRTRLTLLFALGGVLGQVSVLNTFEHLHTPLLITLQRVGIGLLIGLLSGAVLGAAAILLARFVVPGTAPGDARTIPAEPAPGPS